jgi:hypothetical protein
VPGADPGRAAHRPPFGLHGQVRRELTKRELDRSGVPVGQESAQLSVGQGGQL